MKRSFLILTLVAAGTAWAADPPKPLITKTNGAGFVSPEYGRSEMCNVFADRVEITRHLGFHGPTALTLNETRAFSISGDIGAVIREAAAEDLEEKPNGLCDGPHTNISADGVLLFTTGGCGSPRKERTGAASYKLRDIVDQYCPRTFDFSNK